MDEISRITQQATAFRRAIERCRDRLLAISLTDFPYGSCGDASDMLGMFLMDTIDVKAEYVSGWHSAQSHAWLMYSALDIDITADQFGNAPVIVTTESTWHICFSVETRRSPGIGGAAGGHLADLKHDYQMVLAATQKPNS